MKTLYKYYIYIYYILQVSYVHLFRSKLVLPSVVPVPGQPVLTWSARWTAKALRAQPQAGISHGREMLCGKIEQKATYDVSRNWDICRGWSKFLSK